jgi:glycosyltransferase involved in cell wall biosynthesis
MSLASKHILFLCSWYPNKIQPTNGNFIQKHAEAVSLSNTVTVINIQPDPRIKKIEFVEKLSENLNTIIIYIPVKNNPLFKYLSYKKAFKQAFKRAEEIFGKIELIHLHHLFPLGYLIQNINIPLVITEHYSGFTLDNKLDSKQIKLAQKLFRKACKITVVSEYLKENVNKYLQDSSKIEVIGNVIDTEIFKPIEKNTLDKTHFVHISNGDDAAKNVFGILKAVKHLTSLNTNFKLTFVCDGDMKILNEKARELGIYNNFVFFKSEQTPQEIAYLLQEADALVMFSNYETFGIVCAESLACGTPVIATDIPATKELVNESNSILIETENIEMLTSAMMSIIELPLKIEQEKEFQVINTKFSKSVISEKFNTIYSNCSK